MDTKPGRKYDLDFKRNLVLLSGGPGRTVSEVAENLGIGKRSFVSLAQRIP